MYLSYKNTFHEVREVQPQIAICGIASIEPHGRHLPVGTDQILIEEIAKQVADKMKEKTYLVPGWPFGTSIVHMGSSGTVSLNYTTLMKVVNDLVECLYEQGIGQIAVINNHGRAGGARVIPQGNYIVKTAVRQLNYKYPDLSLIWVQPFSEAGAELSEMFDPIADDVHAGDLETSLLLYLKKEVVKGNSENYIPDLTEDYLNHLPFSEISKTGVWGRPEEATCEKGEKALEVIVQKTIEYIEKTFAELKKLKKGV